MVRWLLTILTGGGGVAADGRHANNAEGYAEQRPIEWPSTAAWTILSSPFFPFLRSSARGGSIEGSRTRSNFRFEDAYEEDARDIPVSTCHAYVRAAAESRRRVGIGKGQVRGGVNSALIGDEGKSGDRKAVVERCRVVGNFMETRIYA